jgi:hypothetical protein
VKTYLLFGIDGEDLQDARARIERALGIRMELHDSDYLCGDYYRFGRVGGENFILQKNFDEVEGEWTDPGCTEFGLLLYASETDRAEFLCAALSGDAKLVSRQEL